LSLLKACDIILSCREKLGPKLEEYIRGIEGQKMLLKDLGASTK